MTRKYIFSVKDDYVLSLSLWSRPLKSSPESETRGLWTGASHYTQNSNSQQKNVSSQHALLRWLLSASTNTSRGVFFTAFTCGRRADSVQRDGRIHSCRYLHCGLWRSREFWVFLKCLFRQESLFHQLLYMIRTSVFNKGFSFCCYLRL